MNIVRFVEPITVTFKKSAGGITTLLEAGRDYVISAQHLDRISQDEKVKARLYKVTRLEPRLVPFHVGAKKPGTQRLLFFNGSGGYGDQILSWPVAKWLSTQGYEVHILADPGNQCCWYNFPWVKTIQVEPIPYEQFKLFDAHFVMEHVNNLDEHQDQLHSVDAMLNRMGADYRVIDPAHKVCAPIYTWLEQQTPRSVFTDKPKLGIYQLTSANAVRALLPSDSAFLLYKLAEATPDIHWLAIYDEFNNREFVDMLKCRECQGQKLVPDPNNPPRGGTTFLADCPECKGTGFLRSNIQPYMSPSLRDLWALTAFRASIVVSPDSMMVHVAGCQGVPCVGLWGPVGPNNRMAYYKNHLPIFHREACPHAPCFAYMADFPKYCPPRGSAKRTVCEVTAAVTPQEVVDAVLKIRR